MQSLDDSMAMVPTETRNQVIDTAVDAIALQELLHHRSLVTCLPPEILAYIFELYVTRLAGLTHDGNNVQGPFCLAQVCKLWRAVAESDPHLWTSIHFFLSESHQNREEDMPRVQTILDLHLKRSGTLPMSLTFTDHRIYDLVTEDLISLLVNRLQTYAQRWTRISFQLPSDYFPSLFKFTPSDLSSLEHLHICGNTGVLGHRIVSGLQLNLESATNLKSLNYSGPGPSMDDVRLPWENLVEVSFGFSPRCGDSFTLARQFRYLAQCQNITTCSLGVGRYNRVDGTLPITLPCLQTLRVRRLSPYGRAHPIIDLLILPQLQTLEIDASVLVGWNLRWHDRNFSNLLTRSGCTLLRLSIQDVDFPNDELVRCLALSPTLISLRFIPCPRSQGIGDVIQEMDVSRTLTGGPLIPQLREITLASSVEGFLDPMLAMFRSRVGSHARAAGVAALRHAKVVFFDMWHATDVVRVRNSGRRLEKVETVQTDLAQWVSENRNGNGGDDDEHEDMLEASVVVDSPYLPEYIDVQ